MHCGGTSMRNITLNMIVKNEAHVIERCLSAARPLIDAWCIVDTGSAAGQPGRTSRGSMLMRGTLPEPGPGSPSFPPLRAGPLLR